MIINLRFKSLIVILFAGSTLALSALSEDQSTESNKSQSLGLSNVTISNDSSAHPLKGEVERIDIDLEKLRGVGSDLKAVLKAAGALYDEVTIQPMQVITQPSQIGSGTIINLPVGVQPTGPVTPNKKRVDLAIKNMNHVISMLKQNVDDFVVGKKELNLPEETITKLDPQFQAWINTVNSVSAKQDRLNEFAKSPPYDNEAIAFLVSEIKKDVKSLDKTRLAIYKTIKKQGDREGSKQRN